MIPALLFAALLAVNFLFILILALSGRDKDSERDKDERHDGPRIVISQRVPGPFDAFKDKSKKSGRH